MPSSTCRTLAYHHGGAPALASKIRKPTRASLHKASQQPIVRKGGLPQAFPRKLYDLINLEPDSIIAWSVSGECFFLRDQPKFVQDILPRHFRHQRFSSFQRQLNLYGFKRSEKGPREKAYSHKLFHRDQPELLETIRRTPQWSAAKEKRKNSASDRRAAQAPSLMVLLGDKMLPAGTALHPHGVNKSFHDLHNFLSQTMATDKSNNHSQIENNKKKLCRGPQDYSAQFKSLLPPHMTTVNDLLYEKHPVSDDFFHLTYGLQFSPLEQQETTEEDTDEEWIFKNFTPASLEV